MRTPTIALLPMLGGHGVPALADLPLTVEDLVTDKGKFKAELSLAYANLDQTGVSTGDPIASPLQNPANPHEWLIEGSCRGAGTPGN